MNAQNVKTEPPENSKFSAIRAFVGTSLSSAAVTIMTFLSGILIARILEPAARGDYGTIILVVQLFSTLGCLSFFNASVIYLRRHETSVRTLISSMALAALTISTLSTVAFLLIIPILPLNLTTISYSSLAFIGVIYLYTLMTIQCFSAAERGQLNFDRLNISRVSAPLLFTFLLFISWITQTEKTNVALVASFFLISKIPEILIISYSYWRHLAHPLRGKFVYETIPLGLRLHAAVALGAISTQIDRIIAVGALDSALLGQYFVAYSAVGAAFSMLTTVMNTIVLPYLAGLEGSRRKNEIMRIFRMSVLLTSLAAIAGYLLLPHFIPFMYGDLYDQAGALSVSLILPMSILPIRAMILEASRSRGRGWPAVEISLISMGIMILGYFVTAYKNPENIIITFFFANLISLFSGMRHLWKDGDIYLDCNLIPQASDFLWILKKAAKRLKL